MHVLNADSLNQRDRYVVQHQRRHIQLLVVQDLCWERVTVSLVYEILCRFRKVTAHRCAGVNLPAAPINPPK